MGFIVAASRDLRVENPEQAATQHVREQYPGLLDAIGAAADRAIGSWPIGAAEGDTEDAVDGAVVRSAFRSALDGDGLRARLPAVLASAVRAVGGSLRASPVPAPPYVVVTSHGLLLRATTDAGRLVIELRVFERKDDRYRRLDDVQVSATLE